MPEISNLSISHVVALIVLTITTVAVTRFSNFAITKIYNLLSETKSIENTNATYKIYLKKMFSDILTTFFYISLLSWYILGNNNTVTTVDVLIIVLGVLIIIFMLLSAVFNYSRYEVRKKDKTHNKRIKADGKRPAAYSGVGCV